MHKLLFLFLLITVPYFADAQQKNARTPWHLTITDSATNKGISMATVAINNKRYYITNSNGAIDIDKSFIKPTDSVIISCIGYQSEVLVEPDKCIYPANIVLSSLTVGLNEVKVNSSYLKLGDKKKAYNVHGLTVPDEAYAQFIPNNKKVGGVIISVEYVMNDELHGMGMPFRVRLFTKKQGSLTLDQELTSDSIIVYNPDKKNRIVVDVSKYNIQLPEDGVIAVFETLPRTYYNKTLTLYNQKEMVSTPGIDMDQQKNFWQIDHTKTDRKGPYSMVGPAADRWNWEDAVDQWYVYADGNNFAITITVNTN